MSPRDVARALERSRRTLPGVAGVEHLEGFGLLGLTFQSGDVLAFRCFTASSIGPPYLSVWHRHPNGRWVIHTNVAPARACPRWFGPALHAFDADDIVLTWLAPAELSITAARSRLHLALRLAATPVTRLIGAAAPAAPGMLWRSRHAGAVAGRLLRTGRLSFAGRVPAGHEYVIRPRALWRIAGAAAVIDGRDAGSITTPSRQASLGEFLIPSRGLFATGRVTFLRRGAEEAP
ncbi:MAG TPA: hypothetical protein VFZ69_09470 [Longimicrobiales bacterium]